MKGSSKVIMGATMAMVIILVFVLALVLVLLAELYCSLLLRRRKLNSATKRAMPETVSISISSPQQVEGQLVPSPLSSFYAQGVLDCPRSFLFPKLPSKREADTETGEKKVRHGKLHEFLRVQSPHQLGLASPSPSPSPSYISVFRPQLQNPAKAPEIGAEQEGDNDIEAGYGGKRENFMYISNPIYDNEAARTSRVDTPFETPDSSPSRMDRSESASSRDEDEEEVGNNVAGVSTSSPTSLPLTPIKELPPKALSLRDARSLGTSISDSTTQIGRSSSSSSETPCTSPSW